MSGLQEGKAGCWGSVVKILALLSPAEGRSRDAGFTTTACVRSSRGWESRHRELNICKVLSAAGKQVAICFFEPFPAPQQSHCSRTWRQRGRPWGRRWERAHTSPFPCSSRALVLVTSVAELPRSVFHESASKEPPFQIQMYIYTQ